MSEESEWHWTDGLGGEGEKPEWLQEKYTTVQAQAEAYPALEQRFSKFSNLGDYWGAPEGDEGYKTDGFLPADAKVEIGEDDVFVNQFLPVLQEMNIGQSGVDKLAQMYFGLNNDAVLQAEAFKTAQMEALGDKAEQRITNVRDYLTANLDKTQAEALAEVATTAAGVEAVEKLMSMAKGASMIDDGANTPPPVTAEEIRALQFAEDEFGNRKMADPEYAAMVRAKMKLLHGDGDYLEVVG